MALFNDNANGFASRLQNIDKQGIVELTQEVENLTKATADYEQKANEAFSNGVALTKRQKDAYRDYEDSVKSVASAQKALREALDATNEAWRGAKGADKKELVEKINAYKELQKAVTEYKSGAQSALTAGAKVYNDKAVKRNVIPDASKNVNGNEVVSKKQIEAQTESFVKTANEVREKIAQSTTPQATNTNEIVPKEQVVAQAEEVVKAADEACQKVAQSAVKNAQQVFKVWDATQGKYVEKAIPTNPQVQQNKKQEEEQQLSNAEKRRLAIERGFYRQPSGGDSGAQAQTQQYVTLQMLLNEIEATKNRILNAKMGSANSKNILFDANEIKEQEKHLKELMELKKLLFMDDPSKENKNKNPLETEGKSFNELVDLMKSKQAELQSTQSGLINSDNVQADCEKIKQLEKEISNLQSMIQQARSGSNSQAFLQAFAGVGHVIESIGKGAVQGFGNIFSNLTKGIISGINSAISAIKSFGQSVISLASSAFGSLKSAISTTIGNMHTLVSGGFNLAKKGIEGLASGIKSIRSHINSVVKKSTPNLVKSFGSIKSMLIRRIKRTFISSIFNQAKEGLQQLAKSSNDFNQAMSNIKNTSKQVAGNLSITLGNLLQTIEPYLTTLLGWLNKVFEAINGIFAMLSGKSTMLVAKKNTDNYAKSLKGASSSAKDLNHQLYGFDEITRQEDNNNSGSGSTIGYEQQEVGDVLGSWSDFFKDILDAFKNGEFEKVGSLIAEKLADITKKINDWVVNLTPKAKEWASNIARILNGLLKPELFENMGELLGNGLNLVFGVLNTFLTTFHFDEFGQMLAIGLNKLINTVDWETVGATIINYFNAIWKTLGNFFATFDWETFGNKLAVGFASMVDNIDWESFKLMISEGLRVAFGTLYTFVSQINWTQVATDIVTNLTDLVQNRIDWQLISDALVESVKALQDVFDILANSDFFIQLAVKLGGVIHDVLFSGISWERLGADILIGLSKLRTAFWTLIEKLDLPNLAIKLASAINGLLTDENVKKAWEESAQKTKEGLNSIITAFGNLVKGPPDGIDFGCIGTKIGEEVGGLLNSVDWEALGEAIGNGISQLAIAFGNLVTSLDLPTIATNLASGINALFDPEKGGASFEGAVKAVSEGLNGVIEAFAKLLSPEEGINFAQISETLAKSINGLIAQTDWATLIETLLLLHIDIQQAFWDVIAQIDFADIGQKLADGINGLFKDANGNVDTSKFASLGKSIGDGFKSILEGVETLVEGIDLEAVLQGIFAFLESIDWAKIISKTITLISGLLIKAIDALPSLVQGIIDLIGQIDWLEIGKAIITGISGILSSAVQAVGGVITSIWNAIFGGEETVTVPQILSDDVMAQLKDQMGEAGKELAHELNQSLIENINDAGSDYEAARQLFLNSAAEIGLGYQDKLEETLRKNGVSEATIASLSQQTKAVFDACAPTDATVESIKEKFRESGIWITDGLAESLIGQGQKNVASALQLLALGVDQDTIAMLDMSHLNENLTAYMNESGESIEAIAGSMGANVGKKIGGTIPEFIQKALEQGKQDVANTASEVQKAADTSETQAEAAKNATKTGETVATNIGQAEKDNVGKVESGSEAINDSIDNKIKELPDKEKKQAEEMMKWIVQGITEGNPTVISAIEESAKAVVEKAKEYLNSGNGIEMAKELLTGMKDGIVDNTSLVSDTLHDKIEYALQYGTRPFTNNNAYTIGRNLMVGFHNGMADWGYLLTQVMAEVCNTTIDTAREILGIASPSKVFAQIGEYTMEGMQIGLENEGKNAVNTVADLVDAMAEEGGDSELGIMTDGLDTVADKLSRIANIFSDIADTITEMGGLRIPTIATGQVIPYRTQLGANPTSGGTDSMNIEDAIYSAFTRAMGTSGTEQDINITLQIDGRKMADIVSKYQRQQGRAWGV